MIYKSAELFFTFFPNNPSIPSFRSKEKGCDMDHAYYMKKVFELAKQGIGLVSPNPLVGSLIVKDSQIIGAGFHERYGQFHAELNAIVSAKQPLKGATLYCNLEPCCHTNKQTPPCAQRIIKEGISRVVIANRDPNPEVNGGGIALLKQMGIEVIENICQEEGELLNEVFFTFHRKKRPFIHLKYAQTLDGNIACSSGDSKWITHENARKKAHEMRLKYDAILIGAGTLVADNPALTIRFIESEKKCPKKASFLIAVRFPAFANSVRADLSTTLKTKGP